MHIYVLLCACVYMCIYVSHKLLSVASGGERCVGNNTKILTDCVASGGAQLIASGKQAVDAHRVAKQQRFIKYIFLLAFE